VVKIRITYQAVQVIEESNLRAEIEMPTNIKWFYRKNSK
jgi:hypothetical protein